MRRSFLIAAVVAVLALALLISVHHAVIPLQKAGALDGVAVVISAVAAMLNLPGMMVARVFYVADHHVALGDLPAFMLLSSVVTAALFGMLVFVWLLRRGRRAPSPPVTGRRRFFNRVGVAGLGGLAGLGAYTVLVEPSRLLVRRRELGIKDLPPGLAGLTVLHLTDLHLGWYTSASFLERVVERANRLKPDLVLLTGDYVLAAAEFVAPVARIISGLRPRLGTLAVMGNHDHWVGGDVSRAGIRASGARLLENEAVWVSPGRDLSDERPVAGGLCFAGLEDPWEGQPNLAAAMKDARPDDPRLVLCHNPDFAESGQARSGGQRVDLMLSGHTHGGQVRLPFVGTPITPSRYGARYARGMVQGPAFPVHVSAGVGTTILPVRFRVPPEMTLLTLSRIKTET